MPVNLRALLEEMIEKDASDLHIVAGERPKLRIDGDITNASTDDVMTPKDTLSLAYSVLTENQKKRFETENELDFSFGIQNLARFRGNCFKQRGCVSLVIRQIPFNVRTFDDLGLPPIVAKLAERPRGLVLVTGPDRLGQEHHAGGDDRQDQQGDEGPHHHGGRPDRVHPPPPAVHRQPARGRHRHQQLRGGAQVRAAPGPRRRADRRNARSGDDAGGPDDRRDGPPGVRHPAHQLGGRDHQPHHRHLPVAPAVADPRAAGLRARGRDHADPAAEGEGAGPRDGGARSWCARRPSAR